MIFESSHSCDPGDRVLSILCPPIGLTKEEIFCYPTVAVKVDYVFPTFKISSPYLFLLFHNSVGHLHRPNLWRSISRKKFKGRRPSAPWESSAGTERVNLLWSKRPTWRRATMEPFSSISRRSPFRKKVDSEKRCRPLGRNPGRLSLDHWRKIPWTKALKKRPERIDWNHKDHTGVYAGIAWVWTHKRQGRGH